MKFNQQIYFARVVGTDGPIKIGCSTGPVCRCRQLGIDVGAEIEVIATAPGDYLTERNLHLKFADCRTCGPRKFADKPSAGETEWFKPTVKLLSFIAKVAETGRISLPIAECRERVIAARYKNGETLQQIAADLGITRERVRQILAAVGVPRRSATERSYILAMERKRRREEFWARAQAAFEARKAA